MIIVTAQIITEHFIHEGLLSTMPRGYEYEEVSEDYNVDGTGVMVFNVHNIDDLTTDIKQALNINDGVVNYSTARV